FFFSSRRRHTRCLSDWSSDVCSSDLQFAAAEAVQLLRSIRRAPAQGTMISVSAADPLNLLGIVTPGGRLSPAASNRILYRDGARSEERRVGKECRCRWWGDA